jgi:hypothetical protein
VEARQCCTQKCCRVLTLSLLMAPTIMTQPAPPPPPTSPPPPLHPPG